MQETKKSIDVLYTEVQLTMINKPKNWTGDIVTSARKTVYLSSDCDRTATCMDTEIQARPIKIRENFEIDFITELLPFTPPQWTS